MASTLEFVEYIVGQFNNFDKITYKKMFGEYALYYDTKVFALVCDNQLFIKTTEAGENYLKEFILKPPYEGAKPYFLIEELEDREFLSNLAEITYKELPLPKVKKRKKS